MHQPVPAGLLLAGVDDSSRSLPPILPASSAITAFVGRTLKGPVHEPVRISSFAQFVQLFGGLWQPSPLAYAVDQYFENGGEEAVIVRVASAGRPPTLDLPASGQWLVLAGQSPGSREYLRASVDYDGIEPAETGLFNLVVQRLRSPGSELVEAQEIFRRVSIAPDSPRHVVAALAASRLARVAGPVPQRRPDITPGADAQSFVGYVDSNADGDDGDPLSDYDIIGSEALRHGLFALEGQAFNFLCIAPLARERDLGMSTLVVAARFCRRHHALLLVDPPATWKDADTALAGLATWPFHSSDAVMHFPRIETTDRLKGRTGLFASSGAAAGLMARADRLGPHWWSSDAVDLPLRPGLRPACTVTDAARAQLAARGVNVFCASRGAQREPLPARTLGGDFMRHGEPRTLLTRRLILWIAASVERSTRWVTLARNEPGVRARARRQVLGLLEDLADQGALTAAGLGARVFVVCDERLNAEVQLAGGEFNLVYGIDAQRGGEHEAWLVTHRAGGSYTRAVTVNAYALRSRP